MNRIVFLLLFFSSFVLPAIAQEQKKPPCEVDWLNLRAGLDYRAINCLGESEALDVHVVRIDPDRWNINSALVDRTTARGLAQARDAVFAINANFFDKARKPIGAVVRSGDVVLSPNQSSWQSLFIVSQDGAGRVILPETWPSYRDHAWMAVQAGPRLLVKGRLPEGLKNNYRAERCGVCIRRNGEILFFATPKGRKIHVREMARIARRAEKEGGLACYSAMLFDGGHSVNFFVEDDDKRVNIEGDRVPVFVYATSRNNQTK